MSLFHVKGSNDWDATIPVNYVSAGYQQRMRGFRVLVQTPQVKESDSYTRPGQLLMVWHEQLTLCTGPECVFPECRVKAQLAAQTAGPRLLLPDIEGKIGLN